MKKIVVSIFLICFTLISHSVLFAYSGGNGTAQSPYLISSKSDMLELTTNVNASYSHAGLHFLLTRDLTGVNDVITNVIGRGGTCYFNGIFDGGGHEIAVNINVNAESGVNIGLFGLISGATIKNLKVRGSVSATTTSTAMMTVGGICGDLQNGTISNCSNKAIITAKSAFNDAYAGGICGIVDVNANVIDCYNTGSISVISSHSISSAGGICGFLLSRLSHCYNTGTVSAKTQNNTSPYYSSYNSFAGGICGSVEGSGTLTHCSNAGQVTAASYVNSFAGGICGDLTSRTITNCYNTGIIYASSNYKQGSSPRSYSGGICGYLDIGLINNCYSSGYISAASSENAYSGGICGYINNNGNPKIGNCFAAGTVTTSANFNVRGRICANAESSEIYANCYALNSMLVGSSAISNSSPNSKNGKDAPLASLQSQSWLTSTLQWDFASIWRIEDGAFPTFISTGEFVSIQEITMRSFKLYPNPANHYFRIASEIPVQQVSIYDLSGRLLKEIDFPADVISVVDLPTAIYLVKITTVEGSAITKLVKK